MDNNIPISPFEIMKRTKDIPKILKWSKNKHLTISGPSFWGPHHIFINDSLKHIIFCLKADFTTYVFIGNAVKAQCWRKYDRDFSLVLEKKLNNDSLEWKIYKDIVLYKGKMLPPKSNSVEPYWGKVESVEEFSDKMNDKWIVSKIKELYDK